MKTHLQACNTSMSAEERLQRHEFVLPRHIFCFIQIRNLILHHWEIQGDPSGWLNPPIDLVMVVLAAGWPILRVTTPQGRTSQIIVNGRFLGTRWVTLYVDGRCFLPPFFGIGNSIASPLPYPADLVCDLISKLLSFPRGFGWGRRWRPW